MRKCQISNTDKSFGRITLPSNMNKIFIRFRDALIRIINLYEVMKDAKLKFCHYNNNFKMKSIIEKGFGRNFENLVNID